MDGKVWNDIEEGDVPDRGIPILVDGPGVKPKEKEEAMKRTSVGADILREEAVAKEKSRAVRAAEKALRAVKDEQAERVERWKDAQENGDEKAEKSAYKKVQTGKEEIAEARKRLNETLAGKGVTAQVEQEEKEAVKVEIAAKTGGIRTAEEIMAGLPDMSKEAMDKRGEEYKEMVNKAYNRAPALLKVRNQINATKERSDFAELMDDPDFKEDYDQLVQAEQDLLTKDPKLSGRMEFDAYLKSLHDVALEIKGRKVKRWDIIELVNHLCDEAVENKRIEVIPWKVADELKKAGGKPLFNNYGENGTVCYRGRIDDNFGVVTGATEKVIHAIGRVLSEAYKRGPTEKDMKQRRVKATKDALKDIERRMKARCSKVPVSQIIDRDGVNEKTLLFCKSDAYVVQEGTKREHEISAAAFCVRIVIPRFKKGKDVVLGEPQIVPVQALGRRADTFVEMVEKQISIPVQAILNERFVLTDRDEKVRRLKIILRKMVEAAIRQYKLEHTPQKPKKKVAKKVEITEVLKEETPKVVVEPEVDLLGGCGL